FKAGAKLKLLFVSCKKNLKKIEAFFLPHFYNLSSNLSKSSTRFAECKDSSFIRISKHPK
ncbi:hypothetical protein, partial [Flavobacterium sp. HJSW_4]|uniref:hypothetical protein n=1 Tax=Flavobacterium sp. HJSW_4 TaxID=3344660 RepID=UPI0035F2D4D5